MGSLAEEVLPTVRGANLAGVRASRIVSRVEGQLAEPVTTAVLIAVASGVAGAVAKELTQLAWNSIAKWIKERNKPVQVESAASKLTITVEMAYSGIPSVEFQSLFGEAQL
jgi:hypothetical protein